MSTCTKFVPLKIIQHSMSYKNYIIFFSTFNFFFLKCKIPKMTLSFKLKDQLLNEYNLICCQAHMNNETSLHVN